jgi:hypothetical protein
VPTFFLSLKSVVQAVELPPLPSNGRYIYHANECFDWGTFGWGIKSQKVDVDQYKYFIFMNSSVRGPYLPTYVKVGSAAACGVQPAPAPAHPNGAALCMASNRFCDSQLVQAFPPSITVLTGPFTPKFTGLKRTSKGDRLPRIRANEEQAALQGHVHWTDVLISKLNDIVKLVGPTINCEGSPLHGDMNGVWRKNPHVQSYLVATDQVGLSILLKDEKVFQCYNNMFDTIYHSELGSSSAVLDAGYNIDSLMVRSLGLPLPWSLPEWPVLFPSCVYLRRAHFDEHVCS